MRVDGPYCRMRGLNHEQKKLYSIIESSHLSGLSIKPVRRYAGDDLLLEVERVIHGDRVV